MTDILTAMQAERKRDDRTAARKYVKPPRLMDIANVCKNCGYYDQQEIKESDNPKADRPLVPHCNKYRQRLPFERRERSKKTCPGHSAYDEVSDG